nr:hypothetical protein [Tanacetum cinerariifolium]
MRIFLPRVFESAQHSFDVALRSALERIVTTSRPGFGDWQWRLATLPFAFGGLGVSHADSGPTFDDALFVFNTSMETDILSNPSEIAAPKLMKKLADIYFTRGGFDFWTETDYERFLLGIFMETIVSCVGIIGIKHRHNIVRDTLVDICYWSGISASKEIDIGLERGHDKPLRLADMILYS